MFKKYKRKISKGGESGFTMVELILVIVLTSILGTFVFQVLTQSLLAQRDMQVRKEHSDDAVMVMDKISREIREATVVNTGNTLTLTLASGNVVYSVNGNQLERISGSNNVIAKNVTSFMTSVTANGCILVNLRFDGESANRETKVFRRN